VSCIAYTNWSVKLAEKLGGGPTNLFPEKSLFENEIKMIRTIFD
jgi:hypothetical protein